MKQQQIGGSQGSTYHYQHISALDRMMVPGSDRERTHNDQSHMDRGGSAASICSEEYLIRSMGPLLYDEAASMATIELCSKSDSSHDGSSQLQSPPDWSRLSIALSLHVLENRVSPVWSTVIVTHFYAQHQE